MADLCAHSVPDTSGIPVRTVHGAATVLLCAGEPVVADTVTAIVADCGYTVPEEVVSARMRTLLRGATGATMAAVNLNCRLRGGFTLKCCSTKEALAKDTCVPVFFIHGDADELVPCSMTLENYLACSGQGDSHCPRCRTRDQFFLG